MSDWKPGYVELALGSYEKLEVGQTYTYLFDVPAYNDMGPDWRGLELRVITTSKTGEVGLRPVQKVSNRKPQIPDSTEDLHIFPNEEVWPCPFQKVVSKGGPASPVSKGVYQPGDLLCHEAWSLWFNMMQG